MRSSVRVRLVSPMLVLAVLALGLGSSPGPARAAVQPAALFSDNMVLQRDTDVPVWGWADPGETVTVTLAAGRSSKAIAASDGRWAVTLPAMPAGGPHDMTIQGAGHAVTLRNVMVGEVWLCSGQSNMNMPIDWGVFGKPDTPQFKEQVSAADFPAIRMFFVEKAIAGAPPRDVAGQWKVCRPDTIMKWSAVAYFFGRRLHQDLAVPVGLIKSAVGGTPIESWMSRPALLEAAPDMKPTLDWWDRSIANWDETRAQYEKKLADWKNAADRARADGKDPPKEPRKPDASPDNPWWPSSLYHGMIRPLAPYALRGVIWYQGESNAGKTAPLYCRTFPALIQSWRRDWARNDLPFLFVQLANFKALQTQPSEDTGWPLIREAQFQTLRLPRTAMAVTIDVGDADNIHPLNKQEVGRRLALAAMNLAYGKDVVWSGPLYQSMKLEGDAVRLTFSHAAGGLATRGDGPLKGFALAGDDRRFVWADAAIDADTVLVRSDKVPHPAAVRYAWANNPIGNLGNRDGLPASPFRTDDWPIATDQERPK